MPSYVRGRPPQRLLSDEEILRLYVEEELDGDTISYRAGCSGKTVLEIVRKLGGVVRERGEVRSYGAGLLSSYGEIQQVAQADLRPLDIARMGHALEDMGRHGLATEAGRAADQAFHNTILEAARNGPLMALSSSIAAAVTWTTIFKYRRQVLPRDPMPAHRALYEAIVSGDPAAARATMTELIRLALSDTEMALRP